MSGTRVALPDDRGSAPVEFVLVSVLLTALTFAVLQFGFAVYVRNVVHDAAVEGAYHAALADTTPAEGADRAAEVIQRAIGDAYAQDVSVAEDTAAGYPQILVTVRTPMPLIGLIGLPEAWEVTGRAPAESLE